MRWPAGPGSPSQPLTVPLGLLRRLTYLVRPAFGFYVNSFWNKKCLENAFTKVVPFLFSSSICNQFQFLYVIQLFILWVLRFSVFAFEAMSSRRAVWPRRPWTKNGPRLQLTKLTDRFCCEMWRNGWSLNKNIWKTCSYWLTFRFKFTDEWHNMFERMYLFFMQKVHARPTSAASEACTKAAGPHYIQAMYWQGNAEVNFILNPCELIRDPSVTRMYRLAQSKMPSEENQSSETRR